MTESTEQYRLQQTARRLAQAGMPKQQVAEMMSLSQEQM